MIRRDIWRWLGHLYSRVVLKKQPSSRRTFAAMAAGFGLSVLAYTYYGDWFDAPAWKGVANYVAPWVVALAIAVTGSPRGDASPA